MHADQFGCECGQLIDPIRPAEFDDDVLTLDPAELAYQLQALRPQRVEEQADAREVAPRSAEAGHEALLDRVAAAIEDDRNRRGGLLCRQS